MKVTVLSPPDVGILAPVAIVDDGSGGGIIKAAAGEGIAIAADDGNGASVSCTSGVTVAIQASNGVSLVSDAGNVTFAADNVVTCAITGNVVFTCEPDRFTTNRGRRVASVSKTTTYTIAANDDEIIADASGGAFTVSLPASPLSGDQYTIKAKASANNVTVSGNGHNIDGAANLTINSYGRCRVIYDGTEWCRIT